MKKLKKYAQDLRLEFACKFLQEVHGEFLKRRKTLNHRGTLQLEKKASASVEQLLISLEFSDWPFISLVINDQHQAALSVISRHRSNRGKTLVRLADLVLIDDACRIEGAFEEIVTIAFQWRDGREDLEPTIELRKIWNALGLRVYDPVKN